MTDADYPDTPLGNLQLCATSHEWSCSDEEFARWLQKVKADMIRELIIRGPKKYYDLDLYGHVGAAIPVRWLEDETDRVQG